MPSCLVKCMVVLCVGSSLLWYEGGKLTQTTRHVTAQSTAESHHALSKAFSDWEHTPFGWCVPGSGDGKRSGLFYVKVPKAASSTSGGIANRISHEVGKRLNITTGHKPCHVKMRHGEASRSNNDYQKREKSTSFLWSIVREPASRRISEIFHFDVSRGGMNPTDDNLLKQLKSGGRFQLKYLSTRPLADDLNRTGIETAVREILHEYDFLGVAERLDESVVALRLILGLETGDVLYLNSKRSGGYDDGRSHAGCVKIVKSFLSANVSSYLSSPEWRKRSLPDRTLYEAVNRSLDATIDRLGRSRFEEALLEHRKYMQIVEHSCAASAVYPCSADGVKQFFRSQKNCYWNDGGCGYPCIDALMSKQNR